ncbi:recombinase family protein [Flavobacterium sp. SUN052]|uniref:recombinase family protein n=1 Tax=Flavobacterium sp. SUN052 TaxID=3002441 RepID=UPI00237EAED2|nr:recombinase family protein [Flavobacterium sp. SUN052]MEC4005503.1 recombinase family protein [Flavobacterium sp. SUN052]
MNKARYIRQSSKSQTNLRQLAKAHPDETLFIDIISGSIPFAERPEGKKLIEAIETGINYVTFHDLSRAGRSTLNVIETLTFFQNRGVVVKIENLGLESIVDGKINPIFNLITTVLSEINSLERTTLLERQAEGIYQAKLRGIYKGRVKNTFESDEIILTKYKKVVKELKANPNLSLRKVATLTSVSPNTVKKVMSILQKQN